MCAMSLILVVFAVVATVLIQAASPPEGKWLSIDSSSDGKALLAVSADDVYVSNDGGVNWQKALIGCDSFSKGVVSGNGKYMLVGTYCKQTVGSSDYGQSWTAVNLPSDFAAYDVEMSETGQYQVAVSFVPTFAGQIHTSSDYGTTWGVADGSVSNFGSLAMSSIGDHIYVGPIVGSFVHSTDFGKSFNRASFATYQGGLLSCDATCEHMAYTNYYTLQMSNSNGTDFKKANLPQGPISKVVYSADGKYVYAAMSGEGIFLSSDYGRIWSKTSADSGFFTSITTDASGQFIAGALNNGAIQISKDFGNTWQ